MESEQEPMMEAGEDDSESGSMVLERLLAESSEDDEHMERPTSKRDRPNSDDEYCVYNNSGLGSDESLSEEASHSSTPDDAAPIIQIEYNETRPHRQVGRSGRRVGLLLIDRSREYPGSRQKTEGRRSNGREEWVLWEENRTKNVRQERADRHNKVEIPKLRAVGTGYNNSVGRFALRLPTLVRLRK